MRWLTNVPDWIKGAIALVIAVVGFIVFARDNLYPTVTYFPGDYPQAAVRPQLHCGRTAAVQLPPELVGNHQTFAY